MKIFAIIALSALIVLLGFQIVFFLKQERQLTQLLSDAKARLAKAQSDQSNLSADVSYLTNPDNLQKELRARFNYKKPGETMIVIVGTSTTSGPQ